MNYIKETNEVPVVDEYDIIVVGGGIAAMGAALGARRNGLRVLVIEKSVMLGGLLLAGIVDRVPGMEVNPNRSCSCGFCFHSTQVV